MTRLHCCVPHCRRMAPASTTLEWPDDVWICGNHYRPVPKKLKVLKRRLRMAMRKAPGDVGAIKRYCRVSHRCVTEAIERGIGL